LKENKLIGILETFSPGEMKGFGRFLNSGLVPVTEQMLNLNDYLSSLYPVFNETHLAKKTVFSHSFGSKRYDDKKLRYLITDLTRCCDSYVAFISMQKQESLKQTILVRSYADRNCEKAYNGIILQSRKNEEDDELRDASFYYSRFENEFIQMEYTAVHNPRAEDSNISEVASYLDKFYIIKKLQLLCEIQNVKNVMSKEHKVLLFDEIMEHLKKNEYPEDPGIAIYYRILMTLTNPAEEKHFRHLQELLLKNERAFQQSELRDMYQYVLNYCIKMINTGNTDYQRIIFEVYKVILTNGILFVNNRLSQWDFKNIVTISLRLGEFDWCHKFINIYKEKLASKERENAYHYNIAFWHFYKKEYSKTLNLLQKVNFTDLYYQLDSRVIIMKIYVEQSEDEALFYHLSAFRTFIDRSKLISDYQRTTYKNLIRYTSSMVRAAGNIKKLEDLKKKIAENKQVADLQWLLKKVNGDH
jgi:hypothetical protein